MRSIGQVCVCWVLSEGRGRGEEVGSGIESESIKFLYFTNIERIRGIGLDRIWIMEGRQVI